MGVRAKEAMTTGSDDMMDLEKWGLETSRQAPDSLEIGL
jgi:hypothetical protein